MPGFSPIIEDFCEVTLKVRARKSGPDKELPFGQLITFRKNFPRQLVYRRFPNEEAFFENEIFDCQIPDTIGIVVGAGWCLDKDIKRLTLSNGFLDACNQLWYNVEFSEGTGWVRHDWVQPVT